MKRKTKREHSLFVPMTAAAWLCFLLVVGAHWPKGEGILRGLLPAVREAFQEFEGNLRFGEPLSDSFQVFCQDLIRGLQIDPD